MKIGDPLPHMTLPATGNKLISLSAQVGQPLVLYFYPRDDTPGCTQEGQDFRDNYNAFQATHTLILGVSRDSVKQHEQFQAKYHFPFDLLADENEQLCQLFNVISLKNQFGKMVNGIERSTFLFDSAGILRYEWRQVKVAGHVEAILKAIDNLGKIC